MRVSESGKHHAATESAQRSKTPLSYLDDFRRARLCFPYCTLWCKRRILIAPLLLLLGDAMAYGLWMSWRRSVQLVDASDCLLLLVALVWLPDIMIELVGRLFFWRKRVLRLQGEFRFSTTCFE
uniref:Uncharacterized protein n=1 Tax=Grammatophora oceanica TaxID=210454 RepID=A0A7S1V0G6_9STRA